MESLQMVLRFGQDAEIWIHSRIMVSSFENVNHFIWVDINTGVCCMLKEGQEIFIRIG